MDLPSPSRLLLELPTTPQFSPTVPPSESGSPRKAKDAPLDPLRPRLGMLFESLGDAIHFVQEYERRCGYHWRKGESHKTNDGMFSFASFVLHLINSW